ncbi:hypothetical protein GCM10010350_71540 [Streptomyces galilaeus]|jgi:lambda repressor-like predicted transcriptional regulator|nr:hypothetical protein GCM10010350_71540 [Streptomyces galilaeus]
MSCHSPVVSVLEARRPHDNGLVADALGVAPATVRVQRYRLRRKLQTSVAPGLAEQRMVH